MHGQLDTDIPNSIPTIGPLIRVEIQKWTPQYQLQICSLYNFDSVEVSASMVTNMALPFLDSVPLSLNQMNDSNGCVTLFRMSPNRPLDSGSMGHISYCPMG